MAITREDQLKRRHQRVRAKVAGTATRPRLAVYRSLKRLIVQLIDDRRGVTLLYLTDQLPLGKQVKRPTPTERARLLGQRLAEAAKAIGVQQVVFDRGGFRFHGRLRALAEAAREGGLKF